MNLFKEYKICQDVDLIHGYAYPFIYIKKLNWIKLFWKFKIPYYSYIENEDGGIKCFSSYNEALKYINQNLCQKDFTK